MIGFLLKKKIIFLFLCIGFVYILTLPPSILWVDSGTMIAASYTLGISNPPGFPFYILASHLFSVVPILTVLFRLELFTIIFSIALLYVVFLSIKTIILFLFDSEAKESLGRRASIAAGFATISLAFSYQYWSQTQNTEAFIFSYFFVSLFSYFIIRLFVRYRDFYNKVISFDKFANLLFKTLAIIAFLYGLAAGANPTVAVLVPGIIYIMYMYRKFLSIPKVILLGLIFVFAVSVVYSYLPLRAVQHPFVNWGDPQTPDLFFKHLRGEGLNIYEPLSNTINGFTGSPFVFFQSVSYFFFLLLVQFTPILFPFIILGIITLYKKNKKLFWFLSSIPLINVVYAGLYYSGNQESWFILSWISIAIFIGVGFYVVFCNTINSSSGNHFLQKRITLITNLINLAKQEVSFRSIGLISLCLLPLFIFFIPLNRSSHNFSFDYAKNLYSHLEKNAILLGSGDFFNSLSNYMKVVDESRRDVVPITVNVFYVNKWARDNLRFSSPEIKVSQDIEKIIQYKSFSEYNEAMNTLIADNIDSHPIYVLHLSLRASALAATTGGQLRLDNRFKFVPNGLTLKVVKAADKDIEPDMKAFDYIFKSPISNSPYYLERNYKGAFTNILNDYAYSYEALGDWYSQKNDPQKALAYYKKAEDFAPENPEVKAHLGQAYGQLNRLNASIQYLRKAVMLDSKNPAMHFNLGISLVKAGKNDDAKSEFMAAKVLSPIGDQIAIDAQNAINSLSGKGGGPVEKITPKVSHDGWHEISDIKNNFLLKTPPGFNKTSSEDDKVVTISNNQTGKKNLTLEIYAGKKTSDNINDFISSSPIQRPEMMLDIKNIQTDFMDGVLQIYSTRDGNSSSIYVLWKNKNIFEIKAYPGDSTEAQNIDDIIGSFKTYK